MSQAAERPEQRRIWGVDFSGGREACRKIWLASSSADGDVLRIGACFRGEDLPGAGRLRDQCLPALREFIVRQPNAIFGFDFPFGVSKELVPDETWEQYILSFPERFPSPETFRESCCRTAGRFDSKRQTDVLTRTPFSSYNLRIYRQTYYGIRDVLYPLLRDGLACALPMQEPAPDKPWLLEVCPACTLKREKLYFHYKGKSESHRRERERILQGIQSLGVHVPDGFIPMILDDPEGDALDAVIAAFVVFRNLDRLTVPSDEVCQVEGFIYT